MRRKTALLFVFASFTPLFCYEEPIFSVNNAPAGYNYTVKDFYVYDYSDDYLQAYARLHYAGPNWREFVNMTISFFKDGALVSSEKSYIDYETYGDSGMWPGTESFLDYFIKKIDFDSVLFSVSYSSRNNEPKFNRNAIAVISTAIEEPFYGGTSKISGLVQNLSGVALQFPKVFICIYIADHMVEYKYTYADAPDDSLEPLQIATFDTYMDLPAKYDSIKYLPNYSVSSTGDIVISDIGASSSELLPTSFFLSQNYPNPFNSSTTIRFSIGRSQKIKLELFDTTGKSVMTVLENDYTPGEYIARIDANNLTSGCYICVLRGNNQVLTRKMMLVR